MKKPQERNLKTLLPILLLVIGILYFSGCATVPSREALQTYDINGTSYLSLVSLCGSKGIDWNYDTLARTVTLNKDLHKINLMVGDNLVLVDGNPVHLKYPVDTYRGIVVVPYKFKEQVLDILFKDTSVVRKTTSPILKIKKVVVDAGHGGHDPGTIGRSGIKEKLVNLDIARRVEGLLKAEGITVIMTRSTDKFIPLEQRVDIANKSGADLFISIHANANRVKNLNGFEVYYVAPSVSDTNRALASAKSEKLNLENAHFASSNLDLKAIVWDMIYTYSRAESIELSRSLCRIVDKNLGCRIIGVKSARFQVLRGAQMPAVLIEVGFLSNKSEEARLKNSYYRQKMAESIVQGVKDYSSDLM